MEEVQAIIGHLGTDKAQVLSLSLLLYELSQPYHSELENRHLIDIICIPPPA